MAVILGLVGLLSAVSAMGDAADPKTNHGRFTGEVKPVLYVKQVDESAKFFRDVLGFEVVSFAGREESP